MANVRCYECKKSYDYYEDGFCPRCGAFNQPPALSRIDAKGNIVYHDGINEQGHDGSFVHKEYHTENRKRAFTPLEQQRTKRPAVRMTRSNSSKTAAGKATKAGIGAVIGWLVFMSILFEFLEALF